MPTRRWREHPGILRRDFDHGDFRSLTLRLPTAEKAECELYSNLLDEGHDATASVRRAVRPFSKKRSAKSHSLEGVTDCGSAGVRRALGRGRALERTRGPREWTQRRCVNLLSPANGRRRALRPTRANPQTVRIGGPPGSFLRIHPLGSNLHARLSASLPSVQLDVSPNPRPSPLRSFLRPTDERLSRSLPRAT